MSRAEKAFARLKEAANIIDQGFRNFPRHINCKCSLSDEQLNLSDEQLKHLAEIDIPSINNCATSSYAFDEKYILPNYQYSYRQNN